jgi:hypothetical protein
MRLLTDGGESFRWTKSAAHVKGCDGRRAIPLRQGAAADTVVADQVVAPASVTALHIWGRQ